MASKWAASDLEKTRVWAPQLDRPLYHPVKENTDLLSLLPRIPFHPSICPSIHCLGTTLQ